MGTIKKDALAILFGSKARVKLLRFFLFDPTREFTFDEVTRRAKLVRRTARTEINVLERAGVIIKKQIFVQSPEKTKKTKAVGYVLNNKFPELQALQTFLFETTPIDGKTLLKHIRKAGRIDFVAKSGVFMKEFDRRLDVLISMKKLSEPRIENAIRSLESELGMEIRYAAFTSKDLGYRVTMYDKLIRDVFDYSHQILVDRIGIRESLRKP